MSDNSRRSFFKKASLFTLSGIASSGIASNLEYISKNFINLTAESPKFELPALPYATDALEPYIDKTTMEIHHGKHHAAYVSNLNKAIENLKGTISLEDIIKNISQYPVAVRNNGGGHFNHSFFWKIMKPNGGGVPSGALAEAIKNTFGSFEEFKKQFATAATGRFGSGWAWLTVNKGKLSIGSTPNQDNPLMDISEFKGTPVLALDVWEHAYYLKYQNKRADYINNWWNLVNWEEASRNFASGK